MEKPKPWALTARWVIPVEGSPLAGGTVTIVGDRIVSVDEHGKRRADHDLGDVAILPGFVNAHTHLDLSGLRGRMPPLNGFTDWLWAVIRHRRTLSTEQVLADIRAGLTEALSYGTTLLGDISAQGLSWSVLAQTRLR